MNKDEKKLIKGPKELKFDDKGLIPAIIQDAKTGEVLMLAYMNVVSIRKMLKLKKTCFWSRSRNTYWVKGETSGHYQFVKSIAYDCDRDTLLVKVRQVGGVPYGPEELFLSKVEIEVGRHIEKRL